MHNSSDGKSRLRGGAFILSCLFFASVLGLCSCVCTPLPRTTEARPDAGLLKRLCDDVAKLTELDPSRRAANVESLNRAADYIAQEFGKTGCRLEEQHFKVDGRDYRNIICSFGPGEGERVIVGAHYDVSDERGDQPGVVDGNVYRNIICAVGPGEGARVIVRALYDIPFKKGDQPGADDNASGVAGILELARMVSKEKPALARRLDLVAYTLEEPPYFGTDKMGSHFHAESLNKGKVPVRLMVSVEMIGYFSEEYPSSPLSSRCPYKGTYVAVVGKWGQDRAISRVSSLMAQQGTIDVVPFSEPPIIPGVDWSDHRNYWKFGYPAVMVTDTAGNRNPNYHETSDTIDTLDFTRMAEVIKGVYAVIIGY